MQSAAVLSNPDLALFMAPFVILMILAMFRVDERFAGGGPQSGRRPRFCQVGKDGRVRLSDPDGRGGGEAARRMGSQRV
ncbi:hypothetical protein DYQ86_23720 [Acidobacteria bacterium AB60]|nr:hypothetical protein DYQ86_23720 [Acidobacteria bacterium AB60]